MQDGHAKPERIDLHVILGGVLDTEELSLEHDTLVVSLELKRRVADDIKAVVEGSPPGSEPEDTSADSS